MAFETYQAVSHLRIKSIQTLLELLKMNSHLERIEMVLERGKDI